jgi:hypothetical protein
MWLSMIISPVWDKSGQERLICSIHFHFLAINFALALSAEFFLQPVNGIKGVR